MTDVLIAYLAIWCVFLMIELVTTAFFGLALSLSSFILAGYVSYTGELNFTLIQAILYFVISIILLITFPKFLRKSLPTIEYPIWVKAFIGQTFHIHLTPRGDKAIDINGVSYLILGESDDYKVGEKVKLLSYEGSKVAVKSLKDE